MRNLGVGVRFGLLLFFYVSTIARADTFTATGGLSLGRNSGLNDIKNPAPLLGADYAFDLGSHIGIGGFYDQNFANFNDGGSGTVRFMGALLRYHFLKIQDNGFFFDIKLGLSQVSEADSTFSQIGYGVGIGYQIPLSSHFSLSPKLNLRMVSDSDSVQSSTTPLIDISLSLSIHF